MLAGGDDLRDELFAVHADLHGDPVLGELLGQLQLVLRAALLAAAAAAVLGQPEGRRGTTEASRGASQMDGANQLCVILER